jgi:hypothetical protein
MRVKSNRLAWAMFGFVVAIFPSAFLFGPMDLLESLFINPFLLQGDELLLVALCIPYATIAAFSLFFVSRMKSRHRNSILLASTCFLVVFSFYIFLLMYYSMPFGTDWQIIGMIMSKGLILTILFSISIFLSSKISRPSSRRSCYIISVIILIVAHYFWH